MTYKISEIFYSISGEGTFIGVPTVFVRLYGCGNACAFCDTEYARTGGQFTEMTADAIVARVQELTDGLPVLVTLTGGDPMQQDCTTLLRALKAKKRPCALETQGTVVPVPEWFRWIDFVTVSPKPPSSGNVTSIDTVMSYVVACGPSNCCIKVVVSDEEDMQYALSVQKAAYGWSRFLYVQPCHGVDGAFTLRELCERVLKLNSSYVRVLPQLHRLVWPEIERGV